MALRWLAGIAGGWSRSTLAGSSLWVPVIQGVTSFISAAQRFGSTPYQPFFQWCMKNMYLNNIKLQWCGNASMNQGLRLWCVCGGFWVFFFLFGFFCRIVSTFCQGCCILSPTVNAVHVGGKIASLKRWLLSNLPPPQKNLVPGIWALSA